MGATVIGFGASFILQVENFFAHEWDFANYRRGKDRWGCGGMDERKGEECVQWMCKKKKKKRNAALEET